MVTGTSPWRRALLEVADFIEKTARKGKTLAQPKCITSRVRQPSNVEGSMINQVREREHDTKLEAYIERRKRLWAQIINDNPFYSETQIVARMEQFGV